MAVAASDSERESDPLPFDALKDWMSASGSVCAAAGCPSPFISYDIDNDQLVVAHHDQTRDLEGKVTARGQTLRRLHTWSEMARASNPLGSPWAERGLREEHLAIAADLDEMHAIIAVRHA